MLVKTRKNAVLPSFVDGFFGNEFLEGFSNYERQASQAAINIAENSEKFQVEIAFPGVEKNRFELDVLENILTITVNEEKGEAEQSADLIYSKKEFNFVSFNKQFTLPETANVSKISAVHKNGILCVTIPKKEKIKIEPKKISIN